MSAVGSADRPLTQVIEAMWTLGPRALVTTDDRRGSSDSRCSPKESSVPLGAVTITSSPDSEAQRTTSKSWPRDGDARQARCPRRTSAGYVRSHNLRRSHREPPAATAIYAVSAGPEPSSTAARRRSTRWRAAPWLSATARRARRNRASLTLVPRSLALREISRSRAAGTRTVVRRPLPALLPSTSLSPLFRWSLLSSRLIATVGAVFGFGRHGSRAGPSNWCALAHGAQVLSCG